MGTLYEGLDTESEVALRYTSFFLLHRLLIAAVVELSPILTVQIMLQQIVCILMVEYIVQNRPFLSIKSQRMAWFNQISLIMLTNLVFLYTDYVPIQY